MKRWPSSIARWRSRGRLRGTNLGAASAFGHGATERIDAWNGRELDRGPAGCSLVDRCNQFHVLQALLAWRVRLATLQDTVSQMIELQRKLVLGLQPSLGDALGL